MQKLVLDLGSYEDKNLKCVTLVSRSDAGASRNI